MSMDPTRSREKLGVPALIGLLAGFIINGAVTSAIYWPTRNTFLAIAVGLATGAVTAATIWTVADLLRQKLRLRQASLITQGRGGRPRS